MNINKYIVHYAGDFWGQTYDDDFPPPRLFNNSTRCRNFVDFITETITERLKNGSISCLGKVGTVSPPHIVAPLTVEPTKPRLCINLMYLNNWIRDVPFSLDTLKNVPRTVKDGAFFTTIDDKSGFDNVFLSDDSFKLVGFQWGGYFFWFKTLPFGFKLSSFVYHTLNLQPTSYIRRKFSIPMFLYIDDRLVEEVRRQDLQQGVNTAILANYIVCELLSRLGYCINLDKTLFVPSQTVVFLGFIIDSVERCFRLTDSKKAKFIRKREECLAKSVISIIDLQKLVGRCISFLLAVPAAKLYTREMNNAISFGIKNQTNVVLSHRLKEEIMSWRFLDNWTGKLVWKKEKHLSVTVFTDASTFKWGGVIKLKNNNYEIGDSWDVEKLSMPIMVLEGYALLYVLRSVGEKIHGCRIDANVDNQALIHAWNNEGSKSPALNDVLKDIFQLTLDLDIALNLIYVSSKENLADAPSRRLTKCDATLHDNTWEILQEQFGGSSGHTVDLMALDSNSMKDREGNILKHFTPFHSPLSSGVNAFAQDVSLCENCYVFPPFSLLWPVLSFVKENKLTCTVVIRLNEVTPAWFPAFINLIQDAILVGVKGQKNVLKYPSKKGYESDKYGLPWNLWAVRIIRRETPSITYGKLLFFNEPLVSRNYYFLCVGDSMVRFFLQHKFSQNNMVQVLSKGGALLCEIENEIEKLVLSHPPRVIFIHAGINNLSKCHLFVNEFHQLLETEQQLDSLSTYLDHIHLVLVQ